MPQSLDEALVEADGVVRDLEKQLVIARARRSAVLRRIQKNAFKQRALELASESGGGSGEDEVSCVIWPGHSLDLCENQEMISYTHAESLLKKCKYGFSRSPDFWTASF